MKLIVPALLLILAAVTGCSSGLDKPGSKLSSLDIGELKPHGELIPWTQLKLDIKKAEDGALVKSLDFKKSQFEQNRKASDLTVKLGYGKYTFDFRYANGEGLSVYESCDKGQVHDIQVPQYKKSIAICKTGGTDVIGETPIDPTSEVTLRPEERPGQKPEKPTEPQKPVQPTSGQEIVAYYQSWSAGWASSGKDLSLAKLPPYITTVLLAFVRPEANYVAGSNSWVGTGMDFSSDFGVVKEAIKELKAQNPQAKVLLSIGGATYVNWSQSNPQAIAALVKDLGADGADLDYEPTHGVCSFGTGGNSCPGDQEFIKIIKDFRAALPRPLMITTAAWSTGAFGTEKFPASSMRGNLIGPNFGLYVNPLKAVGDMFDAIYIMSYDAGGKDAPVGNPTGYDHKMAFDAYRELYKGPLMMGVEVPPEAWGGNISTPEEAQDRAQYVLNKGGQGMMIWSIQKAGTPSASDFVQAMCRTLGLPGCDKPLPK